MNRIEGFKNPNEEELLMEFMLPNKVEEVVKPDREEIQQNKDTNIEPKKPADTKMNTDDQEGVFFETGYRTQKQIEEEKQRRQLEKRKRR